MQLLFPWPDPRPWLILAALLTNSGPVGAMPDAVPTAGSPASVGTARRPIPSPSPKSGAVPTEGTTHPPLPPTQSPSPLRATRVQLLLEGVEEVPGSKPGKGPGETLGGRGTETSVVKEKSVGLSLPNSNPPSRGTLRQILVGQPFRVWLRVTHRGSRPSPPCWVRLRAYRAGAPSPVAAVYLPPLVSGSSREQSLELRLDTCGNWDLVGLVDTSEALEEAGIQSLPYRESLHVVSRLPEAADPGRGGPRQR